MIMLGGFFHGIHELTYGVDIRKIRLMGVLQVQTQSSKQSLLWAIYKSFLHMIFYTLDADDCNSLLSGGALRNLAKEG